MNGLHILASAVDSWDSDDTLIGDQTLPLPIATSPTIMPVSSYSTASDEMKNILYDSLVPKQGSSTTALIKTRRLCNFYNTLIPDDRNMFLKLLAEKFSVDHAIVVHLAQSIESAQERGDSVLLKTEERLRTALTPKYHQLFTQISQIDGGVKFLVDMRAHLLGVFMSQSMDNDNPHLRAMNISLRDLISLWFSVASLNLERITWNSPCDILQKISDYEAVHPIRNWTDLKQRVGDYRRCFVYTHNAMPREPVVVLHTALTDHISSSIQSIVHHPKFSPEAGGHSGGPAGKGGVQGEDPSLITTAIFYSITSTQKGLQGIELGNYLIKQVVQELKSEFPNTLKQFSSLSPIPGFKDWLIGGINKHLHLNDIGEFPDQDLFTRIELEEIRDALSQPEVPVLEALKKVLINNSWCSMEHLSTVLRVPLMRLCARYLYVEKRRGFSLNPVANFHLRNGAVMWRINWLADVTPRGLGASCGLMVNYRYYLEETEDNSKNYTDNQYIKASDQVTRLLEHLPYREQSKSNL